MRIRHSQSLKLVLLASELLRAAWAAAETTPSIPSPSAEEQSRERRALGAFLHDYWQLPVPAQGEAPVVFSEGERSLDPRTCGACHPDQYAQWQTSYHARAYSPGLAGQLIEGPLAEAAELRSCQSCHAPLEEQQPTDAAGSAAPLFDPDLREQGIVCASCHVRAHRRHGPPRRADALPLPTQLPHGGFEPRPEFEQSRFCAPCHQFFDGPEVAGKAVQNTLEEWRASPQAVAGRTCQSCHMPDRQHLWRGIHDPEMVRAAVDTELLLFESDEDVRGAFVLANRDVGHAFPTYVTPRVFLAVWQEDQAGVELEGTRLEAAIGRQIDFYADPPLEVFDTRVAPGESVKLDYAVARDPKARALVARASVDPDHHYRGVFEALIPSTQNPTAKALLVEAYRRANESTYVLSEQRRALP